MSIRHDPEADDYEATIAQLRTTIVSLRRELGAAHAQVAAVRAEAETAVAEERERIAWWLRSGADLAIVSRPAEAAVCRELADLIKQANHDPDSRRWAEAPTTARHEGSQS